MTYEIIRNVTTSTGFRILNEVKKANVGYLSKFEEAAVAFQNDTMTKILDTLWNMTFGVFSSKKERLQDEKVVKTNYGNNLFNTIKNSQGDEAVMQVCDDGSRPRQYNPAPVVATLTLKTEAGNVYYYDARDSKNPHLLVEGMTLTELRKLCNGG